MEQDDLIKHQFLGVFFFYAVRNHIAAEQTVEVLICMSQLRRAHFQNQSLHRSPGSEDEEAFHLGAAVPWPQQCAFCMAAEWQLCGLHWRRLQKSFSLRPTGSPSRRSLLEIDRQSAAVRMGQGWRDLGHPATEGGEGVMLHKRSEKMYSWIG